LKALFALLGLGLLAGACTQPEATPGPLRVPDPQAAEKLAAAFFQAYQAVDLDQALPLLCDESTEHRQMAAAFIQRSQAPTSPFRITTFSAKSVKTAWRGENPIYVVIMAFPRNSGDGEVEHPLSIDARRGCVLDFLGGRKIPPDDGERAGGEEPIPL
jgi:hypothetical protein